MRSSTIKSFSSAFVLLLITCVLGSARALAQEAAAGNLNSISSVNVRGGTVEIVGTKKPNFTTFTLTDPPRLVIDISEAVFSGVKEDITVGNGTITAIRTASYGSDESAIARVLIGYEREVDTDIQARGNSLVVSVAGGTAAQAAAPSGPAPTADTAPAATDAQQATQAAQEDQRRQQLAAAQAAQAAEDERKRQELAAAQAAEQQQAEAEQRRQAEARAAAERKTQEEQQARSAQAAEKQRQQEEARAAADARRESEAQAAESKRRQAAEERARRESEAQAAAEERRRQQEEARAARVAQAETPRREVSRQEGSPPVSSRRKTMTLVGFKQEQGASRVFVRTNEPVRYSVTPAGDKLVVLELENTLITEENNTRAMDTSFFNTAVASVDANPGPSRTVRVSIRLKQQVPYETRQEGNELSIEFQRPASR
jgi:hypothetical protein